MVANAPSLTPKGAFTLEMWIKPKKELPRLKEIGFTHCLGFGADSGKIFDAGKPTAPDTPENVAEVKLDIAPNDRVGLRQIHVHELASGRESSAYFRVVLGKESK